MPSLMPVLTWFVLISSWGWQSAHPWKRAVPVISWWLIRNGQDNRWHSDNKCKDQIAHHHLCRRCLARCCRGRTCQRPRGSHNWILLTSWQRYRVSSLSSSNRLYSLSAFLLFLWYPDFGSSTYCVIVCVLDPIGVNGRECKNKRMCRNISMWFKLIWGRCHRGTIPPPNHVKLLKRG